MIAERSPSGERRRGPDSLYYSGVSRLRDSRRALLTPAPRELDAGRLGFQPWAGSTSVVSDVSRAFLEGYGHAVRHRSVVQVAENIAELPPEWLGFAMEGAGMGAAVRGAVEPWNRGLFAELLMRSGERHVYMIYVGLGWALARLPRLIWPGLRSLDPLYAPLVLDGFGFHQVFFHYREFERDRNVAFPMSAWPHDQVEGVQAIYQGAGRALWFAEGADPGRLAEAVSKVDERLTASMWAGIGLAAAYAGGRGDRTLRDLVAAAGKERGWLRQGAAFAVEARHRSGLSVEHTHLAARNIVGLEVEDVAEAVARNRPPANSVERGTASYDEWRSRIAREFSSI